MPAWEKFVMRYEGAPVSTAETPAPSNSLGFDKPAKTKVFKVDASSTAVIKEARPPRIYQSVGVNDHVSLAVTFTVPAAMFKRLSVDDFVDLFNASVRGQVAGFHQEVLDNLGEDR